MNLIRLYGRVLALLGSEGWLAWVLAVANLALATAQFAEPVLLGRIIDTLTGVQTRGAVADWSKLATLLAAWAGFGLFTIACGTLIALYADRLAHRRRHVVLTGYFEHVLQLPLSYHGNTHSGRLMKMMLHGTEALWGLWVGFFRDNLSSLISLLRAAADFALYQLAARVAADCPVRRFCGAHRADRAQDRNLAELGRASLLRSCGTRVGHAGQHCAGAELFPPRSRSHRVTAVVERLLSAQMPVLSWWALANVLTRTATTLTVLAIIIVGTLLTHQRSGYGRGNGHVHEFCRAHHRPAGAQRQLHQLRWCRKRRVCANSSRYGTRCRLFAIGRMRSIPAGCAGSSSSSTCPSRMTAS